MMTASQMSEAPSMPQSSRPLDDQDAYFSVDVETDGPIPGEFSLLALGLVEAGHHNGRRFVDAELPRTRYWELKPISDSFEVEALEINGLDREHLQKDGGDPATVMADVRDWIHRVAAGRRPIMVASPAGFDWMFVHWYFVRYLGESPFGYSGMFDLKTAIAVRLHRAIAMSGRKNVPRWMEADLPHSHNALEDALEQAEVFKNVIGWRGPSTRASF